MSETDRRDGTSTRDTNGGLTDEELAAAESLAEKYEGDPLGRICEILVQSSKDSEEANS